MSSVYVVCWIFLQTFQTYFCIQANSVDPDQTAPDLGPHCLQKWLLKSQADDKADDNSCDWRFKGYDTPTSNFQPVRLLDLDRCYKFTYLMANSADSDQLAFRSQLIWIYTVCKDRAYLGLVWQGLKTSAGNKMNLFQNLGYRYTCSKEWRCSNVQGN